MAILAAVAALLGGPSAAAPGPVEAAAVALHAGNASNAVALATEALQDPGLAPRDRARVLVDRGMAHEMLGERDGALADFTEAIDARILPPDEEVRVFYNRGVTLDELGRTDDAIGDYSAAIHLDPHQAAALNNRGNAWRRLGKLAEARADYTASIAAGNPRLEYPNYGLGQIAEAQGQADAARVYYRAALAANAQFVLAAERLRVLGSPAPGGDAAPVVLRPPAQAEVHLRPPGQAEIHLRPPRAPHVPPVAPAAALDLKPALNEGGPTGRMVQLGAWRSQDEAAIAWSRIARASGSALAGLSPQIVAVDIPGKGRYYRLRTGPADPALCATLRAGGVACMMVKD
ncbi:MAG TPA: tetratricopeptide repeat protein [Rhizomicrobium sp.]|nr:tetratricopeptide repeat protein [Rhizomicrobium sp.]